MIGSLPLLSSSEILGDGYPEGVPLSPARPLAMPALVAELADRIAATTPDHRLRVAVDGAAAADPDRFAAELVDPLRVRGRATIHVRSRDFLRPASLRLELGRTNPDGFYERWLDEPALRREVLDPLVPGGSARVLPSLWDVATDRATRAGYGTVPPRGVVLVSGALLLGGGLPFDLTIHLDLSPAALARRTAPEEQWTLPAFARYEREVRPAELADVVVRLDDPRRPAVIFTR
jgi:hypothetical protein